MARKQFTVGLRGLLKPEVDKRAKREAVGEIEEDLSEVENMQPSVDTSNLDDMREQYAGSMGGAVGPGPAAPVSGGDAGGGGGVGGAAGAAAGEAVAGGALSNISKVGGMMKVALGGAVAAGLLAGVSKMAQASPLMQQQLGILSDAMSLFFRPFGNALARYIQPFAIGALGMAKRFMQISSKEGLVVGIGYVAKETAKKGAQMATDEERGLGRTTGFLAGGTAGAIGGAKAGAATGAALGSIIPGAGTAVGGTAGAVLGGAGGLLLGGGVGAKLGGDVQEAFGGTMDTIGGKAGGLLGGAGGAIAGGKAGATAGAALGSVIPGAGTAAGGVAGGVIGAAGGALFGGSAGASLGGGIQKKLSPAIDRLEKFDWPEMPDFGAMAQDGYNTFVKPLNNFDWPGMPSLSSLSWPRLPSLRSLVWPRLPSLRGLAWPRLPSLRGLSWPRLPSLSSLSWPSLPSLRDLSWPDFPDMKILGGGDDGGGSILETIGVGATGGIVDEPTLSVIGEAGPEAVVPLERLGEPLPSGGSGRPTRAAPSGGADVEAAVDNVSTKMDELIREIRASSGDTVLVVGEEELGRAVNNSKDKFGSGTQVLR